MIGILAFVAAAVLALVHLFAGKLRFLEGAPRSRWLSLAGGVSVAYVFVHLLPELAEGQETLAEALGGTLAFLERHIYLLALLGLAVFYGLERSSVRSRQQRRRQGKEDVTSPEAFWVSTISFAIYNLLIGYLLLHREERGLGTLAVFAIAMALHFVVNDYGLHEHHQHMYERIGRWILAAAVLLGWLLGLLVEIPEVAIAILIALLAGGIILNVLKEELPEERRSRFGAFAIGATAYAALLQLV